MEQSRQRTHATFSEELLLLVGRPNIRGKSVGALVACMPFLDGLAAFLQSFTSIRSRQSLYFTLSTRVYVWMWEKKEVKSNTSSKQKKVRDDVDSEGYSPSFDHIIKQSSSISSTSCCLPLVKETPAPT